MKIIFVSRVIEAPFPVLFRSISGCDWLASVSNKNSAVCSLSKIPSCVSSIACSADISVSITQDADQSKLLDATTPDCRGYFRVGNDREVGEQPGKDPRRRLHLISKWSINSKLFLWIQTLDCRILRTVGTALSTNLRQRSQRKQIVWKWNWYFHLPESLKF